MKRKTVKPKANGKALEHTMRDGELDARAEAEATVKRLKEERERLLGEKKPNAVAIAKLDASLNNANRLLVKVSGVADLTPSQIIRSRHWHDLVGVLTEALRPFPDALKSVISAVREFDTRGV